MIRFQTATSKDLNDLSQLVNSAYRGDYSKQGWTTEADLLDGQRTDPAALREIIETPLNQIEIAFEGKSLKMLGSVHIKQELPDTLYFGMLTIEPTLQGQGFGKILMDHVERVARAYNLKKIRITVIPSRHELIAFYERRGFKATGKVEAFPEGDPRYGIPKVAGLTLKEFEKVLVTEHDIRNNYKHA